MSPAPASPAVAVVVMGVSGSGKTTFGRALADALGWAFLDADDFHPAANREKMHAGTPLTDADRAPWLAALNAELRRRDEARQPAVLACSALRRTYRAALGAGLPDLRFVFLRIAPETVRQRLHARTGHFFPESLLQSQFATLEEPTADEDGGAHPLLAVEAERPAAENLAAAARWVRGGGGEAAVNRGPRPGRA